MASYLDLDVDSVAHIGLMFLDGDSFEAIALEKSPNLDYDFDKFNSCKKAVMKIERMNPSLGITATLWQPVPENKSIAAPMVAGRSLPLEGYDPSPASPALLAAFSGTAGAMDRGGEGVSHYYPVKNSDAEVVGALELLTGRKTVVDI